MNNKQRKKAEGIARMQAREEMLHQAERDAVIRPLWERSEDILSILRRITPTYSDVSNEVKERWYKIASSHAYRPFSDSGEDPTKMDNWFARKYPEAERRFGKPFIWRAIKDGFERTAVRPQMLNEDFFAAMLGGERGLGHRIVYCPGAGFWFWDPVVEAFCPTTDAKMELLLSNYITTYGEVFRAGVDILYLYEEHRKPALLKRVVNKAKAILEADESFFQGEQGQSRYVNGKRIVAQQVASPMLFIENAVTKRDGAILTAKAAYQEFCRYCESGGFLKMTLTEFKEMIAPVLYERFQLSLRHDIKVDGGSQTHGWKHIALLPYGGRKEPEAA